MELPEKLRPWLPAVPKYIISHGWFQTRVSALHRAAGTVLDHKRGKYSRFYTLRLMRFGCYYTGFGLFTLFVLYACLIDLLPSAFSSCCWLSKGRALESHYRDLVSVFVQILAVPNCFSHIVSFCRVLITLLVRIFHTIVDKLACSRCVVDKPHVIFLHNTKISRPSPRLPRLWMSLRSHKKARLRQDHLYWPESHRPTIPFPQAVNPSERMIGLHAVNG